MCNFRRVRSSYPFGTIDVVSEGKEGVRADDHRPQRADPALLFSSRQKLRHLIKHGLPNRQIWTLPTEEMDYFVTKKSSQTGGCKKQIPIDSPLIQPSHRSGPLTSPMVSLTYWSIALAISALFTPVRNFMSRTRGWCLSHQLSALSPASRVQWIRDC